jgi:hypothetical protein
MNSSPGEGQEVPPSYQTPTVLLIYTVQSAKIVAIIEERKYLRKKSIWIFRNCQPDDEGINFYR